MFKETSSTIHDVFARGRNVVIICEEPASKASARYLEDGKHAGKWEVELTFTEACERLDALVVRASFDGDADDLCDLALAAIREAYRNVHGKDPPLPIRESGLRRYWR